MAFLMDLRASDSPYVDAVWRTTSGDVGTFMSIASAPREIVVMRQYGQTYFAVHGPETRATPVECPPDAEFFGIQFKLGTFLTQLPARLLVNGGAVMPDTTRQRVRLIDTVLDLPDFDNADAFAGRLVRAGLLARDPAVDAVLAGDTGSLSSRTVQRRFLHATGLTYRTVRGIERARKATSLLMRGTSILDTVAQAGYADQPHLTRALKRLAGQTPSQIARREMPMSLV
jgi:AraC-like DNA-binding protein